MRPSPFRHPLALLRHEADLRQKELAQMVECSRHTLQAIELGKLPLSPAIASRVSHETGANLEWLLNGDPSKPILSEKGEPYSKATFEMYRAERAQNFSPEQVEAALIYLSQKEPPNSPNEDADWNRQFKITGEALRRRSEAVKIYGQAFPLAVRMYGFILALVEEPNGRLLSWKISQAIEKVIRESGVVPRELFQNEIERALFKTACEKFQESEPFRKWLLDGAYNATFAPNTKKVRKSKSQE